ncbi:MAG: FixH family protein [Verrucomicrobiota bacterium]
MKTNRNLWPLGIIAFFCCFAAGLTVMVVLACRSNTDLVSRNYYEEELKFQGRIDSLERMKDLRATARYDAVAHRITLALPAEHAGKDITGSIQLYRPSAAGMDRKFDLAPDAAGSQALDVAGLQNGLWRLRVAWTVAGHDYFLEQKIVIGTAAANPRPNVL